MDLFRYFETAIQLSKTFPTDPVLSYGLSRLRSVHILPAIAPVYQDLLLQFVLAEPGALSYGVSELIHQELNGHRVDREKLHACLESIMKRHSLAQHGSEVAWALYAALLFELKVSDEAASKIAALQDSVVALLALDCKSRGLISSSVSFAGWSSLMHESELYDSQWLLAYEASVKGWLPSHGGVDHVAQDDCFAFLRQEGVSFYRIEPTLSAIRSGEAPPPRRIIEPPVYH